MTGRNVCCSSAAVSPLPCCGGELGHRGSSSGWWSLAGVLFHGITHVYVRAKQLWRRLGEVVMSF